MYVVEIIQVNKEVIFFYKIVDELDTSPNPNSDVSKPPE